MDLTVRAVAVILAGGKGTRSADPTKPKLAQEIGGASLLQWHLRLLEPSEIAEVVVVAGHLGDQVSRLAHSVDHCGLDLQVVQEQKQTGTVAALSLAAQELGQDEFLVILGDILMSLPIQQFLDEWRASGAGVAVVTHPSTHPEDSDAVFSDQEGNVIVVPKSSLREDLPNMSSAGLFALSREALSRYATLRDLGSDVLAAAASHRDLFVFVSSHYLKDTGTSDRLRAARDDVSHGVFARRGRITPRRALFLDRDGVINPVTPEFYEPSAYALLPGVAEALRQANQKGVPTIVVTNQPAIAKGFMSYEDHHRIRAKMDQLLSDQSAYVDDYFFCPHHPEQGFEGERRELKIPCSCRKPRIGMAERAAARHVIDLGGSVMIGDTELDRGFARGAGMRFIHVDPGCDDAVTEDCCRSAADAIRRGIETLT